MLRATIQKDHNGIPFAMYDGILCRFDKRTVYLREGAEVDCFIVNTELTDRNDYNSPRYLRLVPYIESLHITVTHEGFEMSVSMCTTKARLTKASINYIETMLGITPHTWITPGLTPVTYAGNVNVGVNGHEEEPLVPGIAIMSIEDLRNNMRRIAGVPALDFIEKGFIDDSRKLRLDQAMKIVGGL